MPCSLPPLLTPPTKQQLELKVVGARKQKPQPSLSQDCLQQLAAPTSVTDRTTQHGYTGDAFSYRGPLLLGTNMLEGAAARGRPSSLCPGTHSTSQLLTQDLVMF